MSELISGKEEKLAWATSLDVEFRNPCDKWYEDWTNIYDAKNGFSIQEFDDTNYQFRLKPRTITINGIEVPACGENYQAGTYMFVLNSLEVDEYSKVILDANDEVPAYWWQTEAEVKKVVAALRSVFKA